MGLAFWSAKCSLVPLYARVTRKNLVALDFRSFVLRQRILTFPGQGSSSLGPTLIFRRRHSWQLSATRFLRRLLRGGRVVMSPLEASTGDLSCLGAMVCDDSLARLAYAMS
jgi:hypothetical protein